MSDAGLGSPGDDAEEVASESGDDASSGGVGSPLGWETTATRTDHPAPAPPPRGSSGDGRGGRQSQQHAGAGGLAAPMEPFGEEEAEQRAVSQV